jgi:ABC-2 type transport system permease protein
MVILSGFMYPVKSMPVFFQKLTLLNPVRHFLEIVRGVFLKGEGIADLWRQFAAISITAIVVLWLATRRFKQRLE